MINLYCFFHLNLMFSSIEEKDRKKVIENCYWPILRISKKYNLPIGIEATGKTLEIINSIDPQWIYDLKTLIKNDVCEFIGSGYSQIIGPLVPSMVNKKNLEIGNEIYKNLLDFIPKIALVNEQAYSRGIIEHYLNANYECLIMEWNNPYKANSQWSKDYLFHPQFGSSNNGDKIKIIWNNTFLFQKLQRYVQKEIEIEDYLNYLEKFENDKVRNLPFYGSDAEVFDFRPARYKNEMPLEELSEWERLENLIKFLNQKNNFSWIKISNLLNDHDPYSYNNLTLETIEQPIPVKKQFKYNIVRWAVTGRNDSIINAKCESIYKRLINSVLPNKDEWKELCYLWSSDFRTHITKKRWVNYLKRLTNLEKDKKKLSIINLSKEKKVIKNNELYKFIYERKGRWLEIKSDNIFIKFDCHKGLAINKFKDKRICERSLFGTVSHGDIDNINWGADFFTGHLVLEIPGKRKITDLLKCDPEITKRKNAISIYAKINTEQGVLHKTWEYNFQKNQLLLKLKASWKNKFIGALRILNITFLKDSLHENSLTLSTHNGGFNYEKYHLTNKSIDHGKSLSFTSSAINALSMSEGVLIISDKEKSIEISTDNSEIYSIGLLTHKKIDNDWFTRFALSLREIDDTSKPSIFKIDTKISLNIKSNI